MVHRFIVVDDAPFIRELIKAAMTSLGHRCLGEADDLETAMNLVQQGLPDLIFMDLVMPKKNGVEVAKKLKEAWPEGKIVACSTLSLEDLGARGDSSLFDGWLMKPFDLEAIRHVLAQLDSSSKEGDSPHG